MIPESNESLPTARSSAPPADAGAAPAAGAPSGAAPAAGAPAAAEGLRRLLQACFWITVALCLALMAFKITSHFHLGTLWDDAYIFQRYAHNAIREHRITWNPGGAPTYGLTSLAFLLVSIPSYLVAGGNVSLAAMLQSFVCGLALLVPLAALVLRAAEQGKAERYTCSALVLFCLARSTFTDHFVSGMDTSFGLLFITGYILSALRVSRAPSARGAAWLGVLGGLAFSVRPELTAHAVLLPLAQIVFPGDRAERQRGAVTLGVTLGVLGVYGALAAWYFGSPVPLPFYAKSTNLYGSGILKAYRGASTLDLIDWLNFFWPLVAAVALDVLTGLGAKGGGAAAGPRAWWQSASALEKGLLAATLVCVLYSWLVVVPIMGFSQRFYYAPLPGLIYLASRSAARLVRALRGALDTPARPAVPAAAGLLLVLLWSSLSEPLVAAGKDLTKAASAFLLGRFDIHRHARTEGPRKYWFGIDRFSTLPDNLVMATTEVGMLAAMNLGKPVIDMAGLNDLDFAKHPFSADRFFGAHTPDLLYMPHAHYVDMTAALEEHPKMSEYVTYSAKQLGTAFGIALWKGSPHFEAMQRVVREAQALPVQKPKK